MKSEASIRYTGGLLHLENALFRQCWDLRGCVPQLVRFTLAGKEPLVDATLWAGSAQEGVEPVVRVTVGRSRLLPCEALSTHAKVCCTHADGSERRYHFQVFDAVPGSIVQCEGSGCTDAEPSTGYAATTVQDVVAGGIEQDPPAGGSAAVCAGQGVPAVVPAGLGAVVFARPHAELTEVHFAEQSDHHSEYVFERSLQMHPSEKGFRSEANLLLLGDPASGEAMGLLLLAPSVLVRSAWGGRAGCFVENAPPRLNGIGTLTKLVPTPEHYPLALLAWDGGKHVITHALHALQRALHTWEAGRDGLFMSNTWGDRGRGDRISERFVLDEIAVAQQLGTDIIELDDGWQSGLTANTKAGQAGLWSGFWDGAADFWQPSATAFPHGIDGVINAARDRGIQFGLWFAPDSSDDFANWEKDAAVLLDFWRKHGVRYFKLDAIKLRTYRGERNLCRMLQHVQVGSGGAILLDMDLTAETRLSYWGSVSGSTLFLQNRYTDWSNYYPHQTLRALWSLSAYVLPSRLRLEVLNPERNAGLYGTDPLRPSAYPPEYLLAIVLPASGLGWFEHGGLSARVLNAWGALLSVWKDHREAWHSGCVQRIGSAPNGYAWSGFISLGSDALYLLIFRERHAAAMQTFALPGPDAAPQQAKGGASYSAGAGGSATAAQTATILAGSGSAVLKGNLLEAAIPHMQHFLLARISRDCPS